MPDVLGKQLDVALSDIKRAGISQEVEVLGGGMFGIQDEKNWMVCDQVPEAGKGVTVTPRVSVERTCPDLDSGTTEGPAGTVEPTTEATEAPDSDSKVEDAVAPTVSDAPTTEAPPTTSPPQENVTVENSPEFAEVMSGHDCDDVVETFARTHLTRTLEFDGNIADTAPHGRNSTRFDFLIYGGDFGARYSGPSFKFEDMNFANLKLSGPNIPDTVGTGLNVRIKANIAEFRRSNCLFYLVPVATEVR